MKFNEIVLVICILTFYHLANQFVEEGGMAHNLLKILMELIILLFIMILFKYQEEIKKVIYFDRCQKKLMNSLLKTVNNICLNKLFL